MDPYRAAHERCPACRQGLRKHQTRLICDGCGGMMVPMADLATAIVEMTSLEPAFEVTDEVPGTRTCPLCTTVMTECKLRIVLGDELAKPRPTLDRCGQHGLWFDDAELAAVFEKVAGKGLGGGGAGMRHLREIHDRGSGGWRGHHGVPEWWRH